MRRNFFLSSPACAKANRQNNIFFSFFMPLVSAFGPRVVSEVHLSIRTHKIKCSANVVEPLDSTVNINTSNFSLTAEKNILTLVIQYRECPSWYSCRRV